MSILLLSSTRPVRSERSTLLRKLKPGERIRITQTVRVGSKRWQTTVTGFLILIAVVTDRLMRRS